MKRETIRRLLTAFVSACAVSASAAAPARAQSFDCARATTAVEKTICADADLSRLDNDLSHAFKAARTTLDAAAIGQAAWLKNVRNICTTAQCLRDAYRKRIADLGALNLWSIEGLAGQWTRLGDVPYEGAILSIASVTATGFAFELSASNGAHSGLIDGTALKRAAGAAFIDDETKCAVRFGRLGDRLVVSTSATCSSMGGMGVTFPGEFAKGDVKSRTVTLTERGVLTRTVSEKDFVALVGEAYEAFTSSFQMVYGEKDADGLGAKVATGAVRGMFTAVEAIVMSRPDGKIYAAVIDDDVVKYFSNDPAFKNKLPKTIEAWRERFADLKVVFASVTR